MASLDSDKVHNALKTKLGCEVDTSKRAHNWYVVRDNNQVLATTMMSKGSKEALGSPLVTKMARQIGLGTASNLAKFVDCSLTKEAALEIIRAMLGVQPGSPSKPPSPAKPIR